MCFNNATNDDKINVPKKQKKKMSMPQNFHKAYYFALK